jgi:hypothetical protein
MKKIQLSIMLLLFLGVVSCQKTGSVNSSATTVTTDQVADMATASLAANSDGLTTNFDDIATNAQAVNSIGASGQPGVNSIGIASIAQACGTTLTDSTMKTRQ